MKVCLFDIDGTLLASGGAGKAALESAFTEEFGLALRGHVPYSGRTDRAIIRDLFRMHDIEETPAHLDKLLNAYLHRLPSCLTNNKGRVLPGILNLIEALKKKEVALGLLTGNVRAGARTKLGHFGLFEHFAFGGFGDHHFERDDVAREALREVHRLHGTDVPLERIWVIGDTPLDVQCARAIGAKIVAVATGMHHRDELERSKPDLLLDNFEDAAPFLKVS